MFQPRRPFSSRGYKVCLFFTLFLRFCFCCSGAFLPGVTATLVCLCVCGTPFPSTSLLISRQSHLPYRHTQETTFFRPRRCTHGPPTTPVLLSPAPSHSRESAHGFTSSSARFGHATRRLTPLPPLASTLSPDSSQAHHLTGT